MTALDWQRIEIADRLYSIPEAAAVLRELNEIHDPGWNERVEEVARWLNERLPHGPEGFNPGQWRDCPAWVRLQLLDTWIRWTTGKATTCQHNPQAEHPVPVFSALWRPGLVSCGPCSQYLLRLTGEADRTCDSCGRVVEGLEAGDGIYPCAVAFGPMILMWGACGGCRPTETVPLRRGRKRKGRRR